MSSRSFPTRFAAPVEWAVAGALLGFGIIEVAHAGGQIALLVGLALGGWMWWRGDTRTRWVGVVALGVVPVALLVWAASTRSGCAAHGARHLVYERQTYTVQCSEIVGSYVSMAVFFGMVALVGLAMPHFARKRREWELQQMGPARNGRPANDDDER